MVLTLEELKEKLIKVDEISLLEVLNISSEDIVDRFEDWIENHQEELSREFEEGEANEDQTSSED